MIEKRIKNVNDSYFLVTHDKHGRQVFHSNRRRKPVPYASIADTYDGIEYANRIADELNKNRKIEKYKYRPIPINIFFSSGNWNIQVNKSYDKSLVGVTIVNSVCRHNKDVTNVASVNTMVKHAKASATQELTKLKTNIENEIARLQTELGSTKQALHEVDTIDMKKLIWDNMSDREKMAKRLYK